MIAYLNARHEHDTVDPGRGDHDRDMPVPDECLSIVHRLPDILYKLDEDGNFLYLNDSIRRLGYEPEDLLEKHFSLLIHPEDRDGVQRSIVLGNGAGRRSGKAPAAPKLFDERRTGKRITRDLSVRLVPNGWPDGSVDAMQQRRHFNVISTGSYDTPINAAESVFTGTVGIIRSLAKQETTAVAYGPLGYYRAMAESANEVFSVLAGDGTILSCSPSAARVLGHAPDALVGENIWHYIHEEDAGQAALSYRMACETHPDLAFDCRVRGGDGSWRHMKNSGRVMFDMRGLTLCVVLLSSDITRRKKADESLGRAFEYMEKRVLERTADLDRANRALYAEMDKRTVKEAELRELEESYRTLVKRTDEIVLELDGNGRIVSANPTIQQIAGYGPAEITGMLIRDIMHEDDAGDFMSHLELLEREFRERGHVSVCEKSGRDLRMICRDGTAVWLNARCRPAADRDGGLKGYLLVAADITKRKHSEEDHIRTATIESLGLFAAGLGHDFNNLLAIIIGGLSLMKVKLGRDSAEFEHIVAAENAAFMARDLTRQLLEIPRGGEPNIRSAPVENLLKETANVVLGGSPVYCRFFMRGRIRKVDIDPSQIRQVVHNIMLNASQAMPRGGEISVTVENVKVGEEDGFPLAPGGYVKVSFADTGPGIPPEHREKIFDPYFTTKDRGNGLGLAVSYSIIKKHRGHIMVEPGQGCGSVFVVYLPASRREAPARRGGARDCSRTA